MIRRGWVRLSTAILAVSVALGSCNDPVGLVVIVGEPVSVRQGNVVQYAAEVHVGGAPSEDLVISWSVLPPSAGHVTVDGRFVGYETGTARVVAETAGAADTIEIEITPRGVSGSFAAVGQGLVLDRFTSDLWVHGTTAYTGTWGRRQLADATLSGNMLYAWNISDPRQPALTDSVRVDAVTVNDVKIRSDGTIAIMTHEGSLDGVNGVTLLDLADPQHPSVITRFTTSLERGVHNAWVEGNYVYLAVNGVDPASGLRVLDISDPQTPTVASSYYAGSGSLHDVYVRDGLAFLSHWDAGLVILDVGDGIAGGSPANPVEVGRLGGLGGQTHNAWYWPAAGYVFVGEEDFQTPGILHVVDVRDLRSPTEVATFRVPGTPPHNFWLDEANGILHAAWYSNGLVAVDVTGELLGALDRQGREFARVEYAGAGGCEDGTCTWAPQLHNGLIYLSDLLTGLWVLRPEF